MKAGDSSKAEPQVSAMAGATSDIYTTYEKALALLTQAIDETHPGRTDFLIYKHRLTENIAYSRLYGDDAARKAERNEIVHHLNRLAQREIGRSFTETVEQAQAAEGISTTVSTTSIRAEGVVPDNISTALNQRGSPISRGLVSACAALLFVSVLLLFSELADAVLTAVGLVVGLVVFFFPALRRIHMQTWFSRPTTIVLLAVLTLTIAALDGYLLLKKHRFSVLPSGLPMALIREGSFVVGLDPSDVDSDSSDESPSSPVWLGGFWIGATEITNAQYRPFIVEGGYADSTLWTLQGQTWKEENRVTEPKYWQDVRYNADTLPVVGVSWFEAVAYTNWLSRTTGDHYRLPTEAEWEHAACGAAKRVYPWGNSWDGTRANYADRSLLNEALDFDWADPTYDDGYAYAAPAGSYPSGVTPEGISDLAGNVWEWTSSLYWPYPYDVADGRENALTTGPRSLRGGGWGSEASHLRCTNRLGEEPELRIYHTGFRVVRDP